MADNVLIPGAGAATAATDEIGGVHYQRIKVSDGLADSTTPARVLTAQPDGSEAGLVTRPASAIPDVTASGTIDANDESVQITLSGRNIAAVQFSGTWDGDIQFEVTQDGSTWTAVSAYDTFGGGQLTGSSSPGLGGSTDLFTVAVSAYSALRIRSIAWTSGALNITIRATQGQNDQAGVRILSGNFTGGFPIEGAGTTPSSNAIALVTREAARGQGTMAGSIPVTIASDQAPGPQIWKSANYTTAQTGAAIWTPTSGKKIGITSITIGPYGVTAARVILWFGAAVDTTYSAGTDQLVAAFTVSPTLDTDPIILTYPLPLKAATADHILRITTDAGASLDLAVYGYEF